MVYKVRAPALPVPPNEYSREQQDQFENVLRLYFNRLDNYLANLSTAGGSGGSQLYFPYFSGYQDGVTTLTSAIPNGTSTAAINVTSTAGFPSSGYIIIDQEIISYTTTTATQFDGTITRGVLGTTSGRSSHSIGAYVTEAQAAPIGTASSMVIRTVTGSDSITCTVPDSKVYITYSGVYNIQFSAQLLNYTGTIDNVSVWLKVNGSNVDQTNGVVTIPSQHGSVAGAGIAAWNYLNTFVAGDYFELYWASDSGNTVLATYPQGTSPTHPAAPGVILTVTFVSAV